MRWRLVSSAVIVAISASLVAIDHRLGHSFGYLGTVLAPLVWCVSFLAAGEVRHLFVAKGHQPRAGWTEAGVLLAILISCTPLLWKTYPSDCPVGRVGWVAIGLLAAMALYLLVEITKYREPDQILERVAAQGWCALYVAGSLGFLVTLRSGPGNDWGIIGLVHTIAVVKLADTGAYACGKMLGRRKLTPKLSPGKTVEGAIGAVFFGALSGWLVLELLQRGIFQLDPIAPWKGALLGAAIAVIGMFGDLAESLLKRDAAVKDSSAWMPGLGGVLDVVDSLMAVAPVTALVWASDAMH